MHNTLSDNNLSMQIISCNDLQGSGSDRDFFQAPHYKTYDHGPEEMPQTNDDTGQQLSVQIIREARDATVNDVDDEKGDLLSHNARESPSGDEHGDDDRGGGQGSRSDGEGETEGGVGGWYHEIIHY